MASAIDTARQDIEARIETQWGNATPIAWANAKFDAPDDAPWLQVAILFGDGAMETKGGLNLLAAVVHLNVFSPADGRGLGALNQLADTARDMLTRVKVNNVKFFVPSGPRIVQSAGQQEWVQAAITCPIRIYDTT